MIFINLLVLILSIYKYIETNQEQRIWYLQKWNAI